MASTFFYPGNPVQRKPKGKSRPYVGEYKPTMGQNFYETLETTVTGVPNWLLQQELKDMQSAWEASYDNKKTLSATDLNAEAEEEIKELPGGVGVKVSVNPLDWIQDPMKQIEGLTTGAVRNMANMADFTQRSRRIFWERLAKREDSPFYLGDGNLDSYHETGNGLIVNSDDSNPYLKVSEKVGEFAVSSMASPVRNKAMRSVSTAAIEALDTEIGAKLYRGGNRVLENSVDSRVYEAADKFRARASLIKGVDSATSAMGDVVKELDRGVFGGATDKSKVDLGMLELSSKVQAARDNLAKVKSLSRSDARAVAALEAQLNRLDSVVGNYVAKDSTGRYLGVVKSATGKFLSKDARGNLQEVTGNFNISALPTGTLAGNSLKTKLRVIDGGFTSGNFGDGSFGRYVNHVLRNDIASSTSDLSRNVLNATLPNSSNYIISNPGRRMGRLASHVNSTYEWDAARDLVEDLQEGRLPTKFLYKQFIKPRIETFTPSYLVKRTLERGHYFGLKIDDDVLSGAKSGGILGAMGNSVIQSKTLGWMYDVQVKLDVKAIARGGISKDYKVVIKGDSKINDYFDGKKLFGSGKGIEAGASFIEKGLKGKLTDEFGNAISSAEFLKVMNVTGRLGMDANNKLGHLLDASNYAAIATLRKDFIARYGKQLGLTFDKFGRIENTDHNIAALTGFFHAIKESEGRPDDFFSIGQGKAGLLDKYAKFLSRIQSNTVTKLAKWTIDPVTQLREAVLEKLNAKIAAIIASVFGDATGGIGYAIAWAIKIVVQWVLSKLEKIFKDFWKAARQFDFQYISNMVDDAIEETGKWTVYLLLLMFLPIIMVSGFMGKITSTLPIYDPSQIGEIKQGGGSLGLGYGDGSEAECAVEVKSLSSYPFMNGVSSGGNTGTAYMIMEEMLKGFWCYWNQSPSYPELFNEQLFAMNPFPGDLSNCWDCLFWCTFLPWKGGLDNSGESTACKMEAHYKHGGGHYVPIEKAYVKGSQTNVRPGDIIFIASAGRRKHANCPADVDSNHVGVVWAVTPDAVITIHSNSGEKAWAYGVDDDGSIMDNEYHAIQGFGGPGN